METINDYYRYTQLMRNGFYDKLFFIDKIFDPWSTLVDYGCADGFQTKILAQIFPEKQIVGYDSDPDMLNRAQFTGSLPSNVRFTSDVTNLQGDIIFLSSVVHEVYSYAKNSDEVQAFWSMVFQPGRKHVIVRDMVQPVFDRLSPQFVHQATPIVKKWCEENHVRGELQRFEEHFGSIDKAKNLLHFLLKYLYITSPNWMREVHENYLSQSVERLLGVAPSDWRLDYREDYTLPYLKWKWRKDFGLDVPFTSHVKLILSAA
jgi:hypothetical protein